MFTVKQSVGYIEHICDKHNDNTALMLICMIKGFLDSQKCHI